MRPETAGEKTAARRNAAATNRPVPLSGIVTITGSALLSGRLGGVGALPRPLIRKILKFPEHSLHLGVFFL